jgi:predicted Zn-dependent peptidase
VWPVTGKIQKLYFLNAWLHTGMSEKTDKHILKNGMVILGEPMDVVQSVAFDFMLPAGAAILPQGCCGAANVIADWVFRGAGDRDNRQLGDALDGLGLHRLVSVNSSHITIGAVLEASNLTPALELYADIIQRPQLDVGQFEPTRQLAIESVRALDDDPRQKVMFELRKQFYPNPLSRSNVGEMEELKTLTAEKTKQIVNDNFSLSQTVFSVAGKYDFDAVCRQLESLFETNRKRPPEPVTLGSKADKYRHIHNDGAQVHIGLMTETVTLPHRDYYDARVAVSVLSGGMSARLFTEVREKRGLCYAVAARYHSLKEAAGISCYAGTTPEKAQQTIDVIIDQFNRLADGITQEELDRAKVGLKAALILHSESSSSRAGAAGGDYYMLGRVRSLDEIKQKVDATTVDSVLQFLRNNRFKDFTVVTIGPEEISLK